MKRGFTLIELLAVIVILAIIALIATPIVLNIINDTKQSATLRSADFYLDAVEYAISTSILNGTTIKDGTYDILESGNICIGTLEDKVCKGEILEIKVNGQKPNGDKITIKDGQIVSHVIKFGDVIVKNEDSGSEKNQYGFYYNVPYVAELNDEGYVFKTAAVFYEDGKYMWFDYFANSTELFTFGDEFAVTYGNLTATDAEGFIYTFNEDGKSFTLNTKGYMPLFEEATFIAQGTDYGIYYDYEYFSVSGDTITFKSSGTAVYNGENLANIEWSAEDHIGDNGDYGFFVSVDGKTLIVGDYNNGYTSTVFYLAELFDNIVPGLYETGTIDELKAGNLSVLETNLITPWEQLVADRYVERGSNPGNPNDATIAALAGDLICPETMTRITSNEFAHCENLTGVMTLGTVTEIGQFAFFDCSDLENVYIPFNEVKLIRTYAFQNCTSLNDIYFPHVESISESAFADCTNIKSIKFGDGLTSIGMSAFSGCSQLSDVYLPASVLSINNYSFQKCPNLKTITYYGSVAQWNNIAISTYWNVNNGAINVICTGDTNGNGSGTVVVPAWSS